MIKKQIFLAGLLTYFLLTFSIVRADSGPIIQEEKPSIQIPVESQLELNSNRCASNIFEFLGHVELDGRLDVYWYEHVIDAESPTDLLTETRLGLDFYPTTESQGKLPAVLFADEQNKSEMKIRLGDLTHRQTDSLLLMFGFQETKRMMKQKKNQSVEGRITLSTYSTYMECNARHYDGEAVAFKRSSSPVKMTSTPQGHGCGG